MNDKPDADLGQLIGYNLKRALSVVQADLADVLKVHGLRAVSYSALRVVVQHPGISQSELADSLRIEKSNLVQLVDELAKRDLLTRAPVPGDRRRNALMPTMAGASLVDTVNVAVIEHENRVFAPLSMDERALLTRLLRQVWTPLEIE